MKIYLKQVIVFSLAVLLSACSPATKQDYKETGQQANSEKATSGQNIPVKKDKGFVTENGLQIIDRQLFGEKSELHYPEIQGLIDIKTKDKINSDIKNSITGFTEESWAGKQADDQKEPANITVQKHAGYSVHGNYNNVLSICEHFYVSSNHFHENWVKTLVYDLNTGDRLELKDIFVKGADYRSLVNSNITEQIIRLNLDESNLCRPFEGIDENQYFYITENEIVFCFNPDKQWFNTADMGNLEFRIPFTSLGGMVDIYDKYVYPSGKLYTTDKLIRKWLPNDLEITRKKLENNKNRCIMEAHYVEIRGIEDKSLEDKINRTLEEGAKKFTTDQEFIEKAEKNPINQEDFLSKTRYAGVTANFAGKLCIIELDNEFFPGKQPLHFMRSYCYDIKKGKSFTLKDLFGKYPDYRDVIVSETKKQIRQGGHNPDMIRDFDSLAQKAVFFYNQNTINLFFERGTILKDQNFQADIDFSVLGEDSFKIFE